MTEAELEKLRQLPAPQRNAAVNLRIETLQKESREFLKKTNLDAADIRRAEELSAEVDQLLGLPVDDPPGFGAGDSNWRSATGHATGSPLEDRSFRAICRATGTPFGMDGWASEADFFGAVASGRHHPLLKRTQSSIEGALGGYLVPNPIAARIFDDALEGEVVRPRADVIPMTSATLSLPAWDGEDHTGSSLYGGITAHWSGESQELDEDTAKVRSVELVAQKLAMLGRVPSELPEDVAMFSGQFQQALTAAASFHLDAAFLTGSGAGRPLGILNAACTIEVAKESGQAADTVLYENLTNMFARMHPAGRNRCVWVVSNTAIPQLLQLTIAIGSGGSHIPVVSESGGQFRILTRPVVFTEKLPALGDSGDILLADFKAYKIGMRAEVSLDISNAPFFTRDQLAFRLRTRVDGKPIFDAPITPVAGDTLSPFVVLEAR